MTDITKATIACYSFDELASAINSYYFSSTHKQIPTTKSIGQKPANNDKIDIQDLLNRVSKLEKQAWRCNKNQEVDESMRRARKAVLSKNCYSAQWKWVPPNYYDFKLSERAKILNACSVFQLCKSMLMENKAADRDTGCKDRTYSRFYLVVVQYYAAINTKKLETEVRALRPANKNRLEPNKFDFRIATEEDNETITGYAHNSVTPFGLRNPHVPIILSKAIVTDVKQPAFIWMGGGHGDLKVSMAIEEFIKATDALVLDVSDPREYE